MVNKFKRLRAPLERSRVRPRTWRCAPRLPPSGPAPVVLYIHMLDNDYGEEDEPDFSMRQKEKLHEAVVKTAPELLARLGGRGLDPPKDELRRRRSRRE